MNAAAWTILIVGGDHECREEIASLVRGIARLVHDAPTGDAAAAMAGGADCLVVAGTLPDMDVADLLALLNNAIPSVVISDLPPASLLRAGATEVIPPAVLTAAALSHAIATATARHGLAPAASIRRSDAEVLETESTLRSFYESSELLMGVVELPDDDSDIIHVYDNPAAEKFLGVAGGRFQSANQLGIPPAARDLWIAHYRASQASATPVRFEYCHSHDDPVWLSSVVAFIGLAGNGRARFSYITDNITRQKQIEAQHLEGESHFAMALHAGQLGFWDWNIATGHVHYGGRWSKMLGYADGELEPHVRVWERLVHPDDLAPVTKILTDHLEGRTEFYEAEHRLRHKNGSWRWVLTRGQVVHRSPDGTALRAVGTHADITERKHAEERLRESEERFRLLVEASSQAVWEATPDGKVAADSPSWRAFTGQSAAEWLAHGWAASVHPDDYHRALETWHAHATQIDAVYSDQFRFLRADGAWRWTQVVAAPLHDADGRLMKWVGMNTDITEQKEAEDRLRESESFYRQILESIPGMTFTWTPEGDCDFISQQWIDFTGVPATEQFGHGWIEMLHPDDRQRTFDAWQAAVENRGAYDLEYRVRGAGGSYQWFKVRGRAIRDYSGKIVRWFGAAVNVDDLVRAEEALREADRRKDEFLAMLAHELRNPLAPILNVVEILRRTSGNNPSLEPLHEVIERQVRHLVRLVDDLLDVSRVSSGKVQLRKSELNLLEVVNQAVETHRPLIAERQHELVLNLPAEPVRVHGDPVRLAQIVGNLLNNAAKYSDPGGRIRLSLTLTEDLDRPLAHLSIIDTGRGIDPAALSSIFDLFFQADKTIDRSEGGLGLGLSLVKSLAIMHGGNVEARSTGRGHGSEFIVTLPTIPHPVDHPVPAPAVPAAAPAGLRVLVVDDNRDSADSMSQLLRLNGHHVHTAHDGQQAVALAIREQPDVVLLDIGLPILNGYDACRAIRNAGLHDSLIVAMTGYGQPDDRKLSREANFDAHLVKPVDFATIIELIRQKELASL